MKKRSAHSIMAKNGSEMEPGAFGQNSKQDFGFGKRTLKKEQKGLWNLDSMDYNYEIDDYDFNFFTNYYR